MLKVFGIILILASGAGAGLSVSYSLSERERSLKEILKMVVLLKGEIQYRNASLQDAFLFVSEKMKGNYSLFLSEAAHRMDLPNRKRFGQIFRECAETHLKHLCLEKEEEEAFYSLGDHLGYLGLDMQIKQLEMYEKELQTCIDGLRQELPQKKKIFRNLGIMGGILLAVMVW